MALSQGYGPPRFCGSRSVTPEAGILKSCSHVKPRRRRAARNNGAAPCSLWECHPRASAGRHHRQRRPLRAARALRPGVLGGRPRGAGRRARVVRRSRRRSRVRPRAVRRPGAVSRRRGDVPVADAVVRGRQRHCHPRGVRDDRRPGRPPGADRDDPGLAARSRAAGPSRARVHRGGRGRRRPARPGGDRDAGDRHAVRRPHGRAADRAQQARRPAGGPALVRPRRRADSQHGSRAAGPGRRPRIPRRPRRHPIPGRGTAVRSRVDGVAPCLGRPGSPRSST